MILPLQSATDFTKLVYNSLKNNFNQIGWTIYPNLEKLNKAILPIAYVELANINHIEESSDLNKIELPFNLKLLYPETIDDNLLMRDMALKIGCFINKNNWFDNPQIHDASVVSSQPDFFTPELEGYIAWEINFNVTCLIGETTYEPNGISQDFDITVNEDHGF